MKQHKWHSVLFIVGSCFCIAFGTVVTVNGLSTDLQKELWVSIGMALLSFSGGWLFVEGNVRSVMQRFNKMVIEREQELGRPLQPKEREAIREAIRSSASDSKDILRFNHPLVRLVTRVLLVTMPAVILVGVLVAGGAFIAGLGLALLVAELSKRTLHHL